MAPGQGLRCHGVAPAMARCPVNYSRQRSSRVGPDMRVDLGAEAAQASQHRAPDIPVAPATHATMSGMTTRRSHHDRASHR
jgi:hypothetical protein